MRYSLRVLMIVTALVCLGRTGAIPVYADQLPPSFDVPGILYATSVKTRNSKPYDLRAGAKLLKDYYRILEGGCTDGTYAYFCMYNSSVEKCKIVKVLLKKGSSPVCVKVSGPLDIDHGNDLTYNPYITDRGKLIAVHCMFKKQGKKEISFIDPDTLTVTGKKDIVIPETVPGNDGQPVAPELLKNIVGFDGISYNAIRNQYVVLLKGDSGDFLILDSDFNVIRYFDAAPKFGYVNQGIDSTDDYIIVCQSRKNKKSNDGNILAVYKWGDGSYQKKVILRGIRNDYEIENVFHVDNTYYAACYCYDRDYSQLRFGLLYTFGKSPNVYGIRLNRSTLRIRPRTKYTLKAILTPRKVRNPAVFYYSSNTRVCTVNKKGVVKGLRPGRAVIVARTVEGNYVARCRVRVYRRRRRSSEHRR